MTFLSPAFSQNTIGQAFKFAGSNVAYNGDSDRFVVTMGNRIIVARRDGGVFGHDMSGASANPTGDMLVVFNETNRHRADHCTPALTWSAALASHAQTSADRCPTDHNRDELKAQNENENLFNGRGGVEFTGPKAAVDFWYNEINAYKFDAPVLVFDVKEGKGPVNGHFTQLMWKATTQVGCAVKVCSNGTFYACRYQLPGNFNAHTPETPQATAVANLKANVAPKCR
jgi:hypothetical protein